MIYNIIAACDLDRGIGLKGSIPWKLPSDLKKFRELTNGHCVVMGRKTWESLPDKFKPLPNRYNIIMSRAHHEVSSLSDGYWCDSFDDLDRVLASCVPEIVFFIGGSMIYEEASKRYPIENFNLTQIYSRYGCDTFLPLFDLNEYDLIHSEMCYENETGYRFQSFHIKSGIKPCYEENSYLDLLRDILSHGIYRDDRTGTGTLSLFKGCQLHFSLKDHFPILTTKRVFWRGACEELLFFFTGKTNVKQLQDKNVHIWDGNTSREYLDKIGHGHRQVGDLGKFYGFQWRHWGADYTDCDSDYTGHGYDQIHGLIRDIKQTPVSRRLMITSWNPTDLSEMCLPPCHVLYQFYVDIENKTLSCSMYQRSADTILGVPFNIVGTALFTSLLAKTCDLNPGSITITFGDAHIYANHISQALEQISRTPTEFPQLTIKNKKERLEDYTMDDIEITGYYPQGKIEAKMAV